MEETIVGFDVAKLAKEKGFPQDGNYLRKSYYNHEGELNGDVSKQLIDRYKAKKEGRLPNPGFETIEAPTQTILQKWLRESHHIHISVNYHDYNFVLCILNMKNDETLYESVHGNYENLLEIGLIEAVNLIKIL